jgi:hypothetical protein
MNPDIKAKWIAALRSGEYKQATGRLRRGDAFCCLGVLCDLHRQETGGEWKDDEYGTGYLDQEATLPRRVAEWAGLKGDSPRAGGTMLSAHNDNEASFERIAALIEEEL